MKAKLLAAVHAALFTAVTLTFGLMLFPMTAWSGTGSTATLQMSDLQTPQDYIEYASVNDENIHELYFSTILYEGTESCLMCHQKEGEAALDMGHFKWEGQTSQIAGLEGQSHGKNDLINNFCIAVPTNEPRCTQCHTGYGYDDKNFN